MNFIQAIGPYDIKVFGSQKGFLNKPVEFVIRNENVTIQEILILNPNGNSSSCDILDNKQDGHLSLEFVPDTLGIHEIRFFSDKKNRSIYNSFEFSIFDSSKITVKFNQEAIVGKLFKFNVECRDLVDGDLIAHVEQHDRKLKPSIKHVHTDMKTNKIFYEVSFYPEADSMCKIQLEYADKYENILNGDMFKINVKVMDFLVMPYPLLPFPVNTRCLFDLKILRRYVKKVKVYIKPNSSISEQDRIECELVMLDKDIYQVIFTPKTIERHLAEIYFGTQLINSDRPVKLDIFDVSKIKTKMPSKIIFGELNTFLVDTTGAGEGNLEVIIKDGFDTLKAQLLKREKRKFEIGFLCERNTKHDIQVVFNGIQIENSPFHILPENAILKSEENIFDMKNDDLVMEGGPIENVQCSEKMWIIYDAQASQYYDLQFLVIDDNNYPVRHTKIQLEDGRWRIEFIPINTGMHKIQRVVQSENTTSVQTLSKINVVDFSTSRTVYGYKLYSLDDSVQIVFDGAEYKIQDVYPQIYDPNEKILDKYECKYLSDYIAIKFKPRCTGAYLLNFLDRNSHNKIASSPYKLIIHEQIHEILRSSGVYDLTRLRIPAKNLLREYRLNQFNVIVYDSQQNAIRNCFYLNKSKDLIIEFITRIEGLHKIYLYIDDDLVDDNPFYVYVNGEAFVSNSNINSYSPLTTFKSSLNNICKFNSQSCSSQSSNELSNGSSLSKMDSTSSSICTSNNILYSSIICAKKNSPFHFVIQNKNLQGLCVYDPLNEPLSFKLVEDDHENGSITILPKLEGAHKIVGLIQGRDFEAKIFVLAKPEYETLFEMDNYSTENVVEKPYVIALKEPNLEVDVYDPLGERVDVRYSEDSLATFIPRTTGYFKIFISDYHGPVLGSPFYALIHSQKQSNENPVIESSGIRDTFVNEETKFVIRNKDLEIDVQIKDPLDQNLSLRKKRTTQGFLQVFYTPELIGPHKIDIIKDGLKVLEEPIVIYVSDPNKVKVENLRQESLLNQIFSFNIDASEAGEGFIRVNIKDPKLNDILPEINELDDRKYLVSFIPEILGTYEFSLTFNKYQLVESQFKINIVDSIDLIDKEDDLLLLDSNHLLTDDQLNDSNIEYELSNWNQQINNSLNKIMESTIQSQTKRALSPITDTSEEESGDGITYRGETYIENVKRLPDGTSHLLLRIEDNPDLIDSTNPNKARGRYKYRFKRIPLPETWNQGTDGADIRKINSNQVVLNENFAEDFDPELIAISEKKELMKSPVRRISDLEDIKEESEGVSTSSSKSTSKRKESSKSKHFKVDSSDKSIDSSDNTGDIVRSMTLSETESESEINVANESLVTKMTRQKQKKINQEKTIIIEENYVIEPRKEISSTSGDGDDGETKPSTSQQTQENNLVESEEKSKSTINNEVKITTKESGKKKAKTKEKITMKQNSEPNLTSKILADEKLSEKLKPEESIQFEYEHVIEHSDRSQHNTPEPDNKKNIEIENVQTKKTEYETKETFQTKDDSQPNSIKTTTTEKTILITETEEDKLVETIENEKNIEEFSYSQKRGRNGKLSSQLKNNLAQLAERLNPVMVEPDDQLHTVTIKKTVAQAFSHEPSNFDLKYENEQSKCFVVNPGNHSEKDMSCSIAPSFNQSSSNENIIDYYKLQPNILKDIEFDENLPKILLQPIDVNTLNTGEQFKPDETMSYNDAGSFSKGFTTRISTDDSKPKDDDEDSLAEIEENFVITFKSPDENAPLVESELIPLPVKLSSPKDKAYYKPIETLSAHDFFKPEPKSLDLIKAKFENKDSTKPEDERARSTSRSNESIGKLPKSKFEIYDRESNNSKKSTDSESSLRKLNLTRLNSQPVETKSSSKVLDFYKKSEDDSNRDVSTDSLDKGVKGLLNKYERNSSRDSQSRDITSDSLEPKPVRRLSQNIVQLFDRKDTTESNPRSRSSYRTKDSDQEIHHIRSSKSSHSSVRSEYNEKNDDVFSDSKQDSDNNTSDSSGFTQDRVRRLSKIFNEKSENRDSTSSDSTRSSTSADRKSRFEMKNSDLKPRDKKLSDSFRKFEEASKKLYQPTTDQPKDQNEKLVQTSQTSAELPQQDSGVKGLVFKYEKRRSQSSEEGFSTDSHMSKSPTIKKIVSSLIEDSKPAADMVFSETSSVSTKKFSTSSEDTLGTTSPPPAIKEFKEEEKSIKKLISKYEIPKMLENLIEPNEVYFVDTKYQKMDIDLPKKQSKEHSVDHLFEKKEEQDVVDKGVKRLVDIYEKKPSVSSNDTNSSDSLNSKMSKQKTDANDAKKLGTLVNKYESLVPKEEKKEEEKLKIDKEIEVEESQLVPYKIFHNEDSNLTAFVHIPGQTQSAKNSSKIKAVLKIETTENLKFKVSTHKGHKVPFKVRQKLNYTYLMFSYHQVVDFNVGIVNKNRRAPKTYKAQLELKIIDDYNFKIVKRDNLELVPIDVNKNLENIYEISFEPSATSSYILQASKIQQEERTNSTLVASREDFTQQDLNEYERIVNIAKNEIHKQLNDLKNPLKVLFQIEHRNPIVFLIANSLTDEPIDYKSTYKPKNRHIIYFDYETFIDFTVNVQKDKIKDDFGLFSNRQAEEFLNGLIEISAENEYEFQIVRKDTQESLKLNIVPKTNDTYKILFNPKPLVKYTLKANQLKSINNSFPFVKSKLNKIIDKLPNDIFNNDVKLNVSISSPFNQNDENQCTVYNPRHLEISKLPTNGNSISYLVNTKTAGPGQLKSFATRNNKPVHVEQFQMENFIYSVRLGGAGPFNLYLDYINS